MDDLAAFTAARLDEDEAAAKAASEGDDKAAAWTLRDHPSESVMIRDGLGSEVVYDEGAPSEEQAAHMVRYDPARALREVEAKRRILDSYKETLADIERARAAAPHRPIGDTSLLDAEREEAILRPVVEALAAIWDDNADYDERWRP